MYLIDGYNLLHAMGVLHGRVGPAGLQKARLALLGLLQGVYGDESSTVTVVFDAAHPPPGAPSEEDYHGIQVRFAVREKEADELIESFIRQAPAPRQLTVVSDDHRIQKAARRRNCPVLGCADYLDWLQQHRRARHSEASPAPEKPTSQDREYWLQEFADLAKDPSWKELAEPGEWFTDEG
jgi:predicted RNA-binding protein with PIN domain